MRPTQRVSRTLLLILSAAAALLLAGPAQAADWYQIELLVFLNTGGNGGDGELWPTNPGAPSPIGAVTLRQSGTDNPSYVPVDGSKRRLNAHRYTLDRSGRYESLAHLAWRQPVRSKRNADKVYFEVPGLNGTIRVSRGRYLHAELDLLYQDRTHRPQGGTVPGAVTSGPQYQGYRLRQTRRMRSDELHYVDHPIIGALLLAHPLKATKSTDTEQPEGDPGETEETETEAIAPN